MKVVVIVLSEGLITSFRDLGKISFRQCSPTSPVSFPSNILKAIDMSSSSSSHTPKDFDRIHWQDQPENIHNKRTTKYFSFFRCWMYSQLWFPSPDRGERFYQQKASQSFKITGQIGITVKWCFQIMNHFKPLSWMRFCLCNSGRKESLICHLYFCLRDLKHSSWHISDTVIFNSASYHPAS